MNPLPDAEALRWILETPAYSPGTWTIAGRAPHSQQWRGRKVDSLQWVWIHPAFEWGILDWNQDAEALLDTLDGFDFTLTQAVWLWDVRGLMLYADEWNALAPDYKRRYREASRQIQLLRQHNGASFVTL